MLRSAQGPTGYNPIRLGHIESAVSPKACLPASLQLFSVLCQIKEPNRETICLKVPRGENHLSQHDGEHEVALDLEKLFPHCFTNKPIGNLFLIDPTS